MTDAKTPEDRETLDALMAKADSAAERLLRATLPLMGEVPPVDLGTVCRWLGFEVYSRPCDAFGAICVLKGQKRILMVNTSANRGRARFSIAHELGHVLLGHRSGPGMSGLRDSWRESQADRFAAALLMPFSLLMQEAGEAVGSLSRRYGVSREAMRLRLRALRTAQSRRRGEPYFIRAPLFTRHDMD